jgi:hypothetical protein
MDELHAWLRAQFEEKKGEPNSGLESAITFSLKRWNRLTLLLHQAGTSWDDNICERTSKKAIAIERIRYSIRPRTVRKWVICS